jgi:hypothetical protein
VSNGADKQGNFLIKKLAESGTLKDKISSWSLLIESNPKFPLKNLDALLGIANSKDKKYSFVALDA